MAQISIEGMFDNLARTKGREHGDLKMSIKADAILDFKNRWGGNAFNKFLFGIYFKVKEKEFEGKYLVAIYNAASGLHAAIKKNLGLEVS